MNTLKMTDPYGIEIAITEDMISSFKIETKKGTKLTSRYLDWLILEFIDLINDSESESD